MKRNRASPFLFRFAIINLIAIKVVMLDANNIEVGLNMKFPSARQVLLYNVIIFIFVAMGFIRGQQEEDRANVQKRIKKFA